MIKRNLILLFALIVSIGTFSQNSSTSESKKLYNPNANAKQDITNAVINAKAEGKHVLLQLGGNWCGWCIKFNKTVTENDTLKVAVEKNYVVLHVNYSKENKNDEVFAALGYPQRFGFPVFVILDGNGKRLHTQNSAYLEAGKGHSSKKILEFFNNWSPNALDPNLYEN